MKYRIGITFATGTLLMMNLGRPACAQRAMTEGIKELATQIATHVAKQKKRKIAVVPFRELNGQATILGTYISEELITNLFMRGDFEIVERSLLDKLLSEFKLNQTGLIDSDTAKKIGKVAGVDAIVTGTITDLATYVAFNCRLIDSQTGKIFAVAQTKIVKDENLRKIMAAPLTRPAVDNQKKAPRPQVRRKIRSKTHTHAGSVSRSALFLKKLAIPLSFEKVQQPSIIVTSSPQELGPVVVSRQLFLPSESVDCEVADILAYACSNLPAQVQGP